MIAAVPTSAKERPILFKSEMIRAILSGSKRQTRRIVKPLTNPRIAPQALTPWVIDGIQEVDDNGSPCWAGTHPDYPTGEKWFSCPYGKVGDRLWVREEMLVTGYYASGGKGTEGCITVEYCADGATSGILSYPERLKGTPEVGKKLAYGGYREASRILLEITNTRVERIADISPEDAVAEGIESQYCAAIDQDIAWKDYSLKPTKFVNEPRLSCPIQSFKTLWNSINEARGYSWDINPWVWVIEFEVLGK